MSRERASALALVAFMRSEADAAEQKAKSFRFQAEQLAQSFGISRDIQQRYEMVPEDLPPVDEKGIPKYAGKKRGRKPKARVRKANPKRQKRQYTGYTLFMREKYPDVKENSPGLQSREIIALVAKLWKDLDPTDRTEWKNKALVSSQRDEEEESSLHPSRMESHVELSSEENNEDDNEHDHDIENDAQGFDEENNHDPESLANNSSSYDT